MDKKILAEVSKNFVSKDNYMESFRENVHTVINHKQITLQGLAESADMSVDALRNFLYKDSKDCNLSTAVKLARAIGISVDELVGCDTLSPQTKQSLRLIRELPKSFIHFNKWIIHYHYDLLTNNTASERSVEIMTPICADNGNLKMTNDLDVKDLTHINKDLQPKIFMGIKIPCEHYMPIYGENEILYIANDRKARNGEHVVVSIGNNMWILKKDGNSYKSIRGTNFQLHPTEIELVVGYVCFSEYEE